MKKIVIGESYRHKSNPKYCWAKAIKVLKAREAENTNNHVVVKCEWTTDKTGDVGLIKYFRPSELMTDNN